MHFGIIGLGPVGATFAAMLSAAGHRVSGYEVNPHLVNLLQTGQLRIAGGYKAEVQLEGVFAEFGDFAAARPEVILIAVKTYALKEILKKIANSPELTEVPVVSCQNGIDTEKDIAQVLGADHAHRAVLNFGASYAARNDVEVTINFVNEPHFLASVDPGQAGFAKSLADGLSAAGMRFEYLENITKQSFTKAILNSSLSSVCTLTRMTMSEVMGDPELVRMVSEMIRESRWICKVLEIDLGENFMEYAIAYLKKGGNHKPSMLVDIERGRQTEINYLTGRLYEYAAKKDLPVPVTQTMYYLVKSLEKSVMLRK